MSNQLALMGSLALAAGLSGVAQGTIVGDPITFTVSNAQGTASMSVLLGDGTVLGDGTWFYQAPGAVDLMDGDGDVIATVNDLSAAFGADPFVFVGFAVQAGAFDTTFLVTSGTLQFSSIPNPSAMATAGLTLTETTGNTALLTGNFPGNLSFHSRFNGLLTYSWEGPSIGPIPAGDSQASDSTTNFFIGGNVSDISTQFDFTVSAGDSASTTSVFNVVPSPGALVLGGIGALLLRRRR